MPTSYRSVLSWLALLAASALSGGTMVAMAAYLYLALLLPEAEIYRLCSSKPSQNSSDGQLMTK